eukprot:SAG31_NODE_39400_length_288_cov_1.100529_1_plen_22_part_01
MIVPGLHTRTAHLLVVVGVVVV